MVHLPIGHLQYIFRYISIYTVNNRYSPYTLIFAHFEDKMIPFSGWILGELRIPDFCECAPAQGRQPMLFGIFRFSGSNQKAK